MHAFAQSTPQNAQGANTGDDPFLPPRRCLNAAAGLVGTGATHGLHARAARAGSRPRALRCARLTPPLARPRPSQAHPSGLCRSPRFTLPLPSFLFSQMFKSVLPTASRVLRSTPSTTTTRNFHSSLIRMGVTVEVRSRGKLAGLRAAAEHHGSSGRQAEHAPRALPLTPPTVHQARRRQDLPQEGRQGHHPLCVAHVSLNPADGQTSAP